MPEIIQRQNPEDKEIRYLAPSAHDTVEGVWKVKNTRHM